MTNGSDPRSERSREAILNAAQELLVRWGPAAVTHSRIAEQAGIGRATVYRHWPRTDQLLGEAMATVPLPFFGEPRPPFRDWLKRELTALAQELDLHDVRAVATTLANASLWDPEMDARRRKFAEVLSSRLAAALVEAEAQGDVTLSGEPAALAAMTIGPIYYRATIERGTADTALIELCVAAVGNWADRGVTDHGSSDSEAAGSQGAGSSPHNRGAGSSTRL